MAGVESTVTISHYNLSDSMNGGTVVYNIYIYIYIYKLYIYIYIIYIYIYIRCLWLIRSLKLCAWVLEFVYTTSLHLISNKLNDEQIYVQLYTLNNKCYLGPCNK